MRTIDTILGIPLEDEHGPNVLGRMLNWSTRRMEIRRTRLDLLELSEHQLRDIGVTREQAGYEGSLPWWR